MSEALALEAREAPEGGLMYSETLVGLLPPSQVLAAASPALSGDTQTGPHTALLCRRGFFCPQSHPDTTGSQGMRMGRFGS